MNASLIRALGKRLPKPYLQDAQRRLAEKGHKRHPSQISNTKKGKTQDDIILDVLIEMAEEEDARKAGVRERILQRQ